MSTLYKFYFTIWFDLAKTVITRRNDGLTNLLYESLLNLISLLKGRESLSRVLIVLVPLIVLTPPGILLGVERPDVLLRYIQLDWLIIRILIEGLWRFARNEIFQY